MKGFISIEIPTKPYIRAYIHNELGQHPIMHRNHHIGAKLYDLLEHTTNEKPFTKNANYTETVKVYIRMSVFAQRGHAINGTNVRGFNTYLEAHIKQNIRQQLDFYMSIFPNFKKNLERVMEQLAIPEEAWDPDSIRKDYYRYRLRCGRPLLYKKPEKSHVE